MPNRILRDGILTSESVDKLGWSEEVFYRRLYSIADDHGRYYANPKLIRAAAYPLKLDRVSDPDIGKWLTVCVEAGLVRVYPASDGKRYIQILKFNQRIQSPSKFPDPLEDVSTDIHGCTSINNGLGGVEGVGGDEDVLVTPDGVTCPTQAPDAKVERCPVAEIVALYHAELPALPRLVKLTSARAGAIRQRWREDLETLDDWRAYFADVRASPFLMGRVPGRDGRKPFRASLPWLAKAENFAKVAEGKYHEESA